jgi:hypothetical protein
MKLPSIAPANSGSKNNARGVPFRMEQTDRHQQRIQIEVKRIAKRRFYESLQCSDSCGLGSVCVGPSIEALACQRPMTLG